MYVRVEFLTVVINRFAYVFLSGSRYTYSCNCSSSTTPEPASLAPTMQPTSKPPLRGASSSSPMARSESWGQVTWDRRRHHQGGLCENHCSNHGTCKLNNNCKCFTGLEGEPEWTSPDCSHHNGKME